MSSTKQVTITRLSAHTGAEVLGVDLAQPLRLGGAQRLARSLPEHSVLVIRDQRLDAPQFLAAMQNFGEIFPQHNPRFAVPECPLVHYISNQDKLEDGRVYIPGEGYHTDHSNDAIPPKATALHAVKLPASGGDTQFVNMHEAYEALPEAMQRRIVGRMARHVYQSRFSERKLPQLAGERRKTIGTASVFTRSCGPILRAAARRSTSIPFASRRSSAWRPARRWPCSTSCSRIRRSRASSTATSGRPAMS